MNTGSTNRRADTGFTLIELMVVVLVIAVLITIAIPTFVNFRSKAQDSAAKSTLVVAEKVARLVLLDQEAFPGNGDLLTLLPTLEPAIVWVDHTVSSTGPGVVSIDEDGSGTKLNLAAKSDSGACFYLRVELSASPRHVSAAASDCEAHDYQGGPDTGW